MSTYIITGKVKADSLETSLGSWYGDIELPMFRVDADSTTEATRLAREIIDPLETTEVHATAVEEVTTEPSVVMARLDAQLEALLSGGAVLTPYEHYCEAERLVTGNTAMAQVHATLATVIFPERDGR